MDKNIFLVLAFFLNIGVSFADLPLPPAAQNACKDAEAEAAAKTAVDIFGWRAMSDKTGAGVVSAGVGECYPFYVDTVLGLPTPRILLRPTCGMVLTFKSKADEKTFARVAQLFGGRTSVPVGVSSSHTGATPTRQVAICGRVGGPVLPELDRSRR